MTRKNKNGFSIRNAARGGLGYRRVRHRLFLSARTGMVSLDHALSDFLRDRLFKLGKDDWIALDFDERDWTHIDAIRRDKSGHFENFYLSLALDYIASNQSRVREMYEKQAEVSKALLKNDAKVIQSITDNLSKTDRQSLFAFRVVSAQYSYSPDILESYFKRNMKTAWLQNRFLYPLVYHAINSPVEGYLPTFLSYIVNGDEGASEKAVIEFLLRDDLAEDETAGFKAYVALLCHPFDACEILLNHIELKLSQNFRLSPQLQNFLLKLSNCVPSTRSMALLKFANADGPSFRESATVETLPPMCAHDEPVKSFLVAFADVSVAPLTIEESNLSKPLAALARMRKQKYPNVEDFDYLTFSSRSWWFCDGGRLLNALITSLYMIPRKEKLFEVRELLRLVTYYGAILPFILAAPWGAVFFEPDFEPLRRKISPGELEATTDLMIDAPAAYLDRMWIKAVQWELRDAERKVHLSRWMQTVRKEIRVAPAFLTGIDWRWVAQVIRQARLGPFVGNPAGLYVLLLQKIEERDRRSEALRVAAEPFVIGRTFEGFIEWLIEEYKKEAVAFVRFMLEPEDILLLGLAPNKMAALAARIYALQRCTRQFGYSELLPQKLFAQEWETLNSSLLLMSVNSSQFEIPWSVFERDAAAKQHDLYMTAHTLQPSDDASPLLSESRAVVPYRFRNGKIVKYIYPNRLAPMASLIIRIVEDFLEHPGFGLEVILSTRFRHDTMRREFSNVMTKLAGASITSVFPVQVQAIINEVQGPILEEVKRWLDRYMHSNRPDRPDGLFDVVPSEKEITDLLAQMKPSDGLDAITKTVSQWIRDRLEQQITTAREVFRSHISSAFEKRIISERLRILETEDYRSGDVEKVLSALATALQRRVEELTSWFGAPSEAIRPPLTFYDIKMAADGLFEEERQRRRYRSYFASSTQTDRQILPEKVRLCFDLLREIFASAIQHSQPYSARIRISPIARAGGTGFRFSNLTRKGDNSARTLSGHPYTSLDDVIFREGDSGLKKIASESASILGGPAKVMVFRRRHSFHLEVLLWPTEVGAESAAGNPIEGPKRVLVIEDGDVKWRDIKQTIGAIGSGAFDLHRAATMDVANLMISEERWHAVILDMSLDIRASQAGPQAGGHDAIGGLKIAERMFYLGQDAPVIILTAFDAFPSGEARGNAVLGLEDVIRESSELLGDLLVGWVRYGEVGWDAQLREKLLRVT